MSGGGAAQCASQAGKGDWRGAPAHAKEEVRLPQRKLPRQPREIHIMEEPAQPKETPGVQFPNRECCLTRATPHAAMGAADAGASAAAHMLLLFKTHSRDVARRSVTSDVA